MLIAITICEIVHSTFMNVHPVKKGAIYLFKHYIMQRKARKHL